MPSTTDPPRGLRRVPPGCIARAQQPRRAVRARLDGLDPQARVPAGQLRRADLVAEERAVVTRQRSGGLGTRAAAMSARPSQRPARPLSMRLARCTLGCSSLRSGEQTAW
jgi:hypothetical protein